MGLAWRFEVSGLGFRSCPSVSGVDLVSFWLDSLPTRFFLFFFSHFYRTRRVSRSVSNFKAVFLGRVLLFWLALKGPIISLRGGCSQRFPKPKRYRGRVLADGVSG